MVESLRPYRQAILLGVALTSVLVATVVYSVRVWGAMDGTTIETGGYVALAIGVIATLALGIGLMFLVFYSSRSGFDDL